jgi:hypothetical protein
LGGGDGERERERGGRMDSYDVRKATNFLVLVRTGYVGLYRGRGEGLLSFFLSSSSFSPRALFEILDFPSYHQPLTLEREVESRISAARQNMGISNARTVQQTTVGSDCAAACAHAP